MVWQWVVGAVIILVIIIFIYYYNRFNILSNRINNSLSQIDVQLRRRADLVPNLIESVKGYAKHEKTLITEVTRARTSLLKSQDIEGKMKAGAKLQSTLGALFAVAENYPQLKANENFLHLQHELASIEDKIAYSRQFYNDSILAYNNMCKTFPGSFFANMYKHKEKPFLQIPAEHKAVPKVSF